MKRKTYPVFDFRERRRKETEGRERGWKGERKMLVGPTLKGKKDVSAHNRTDRNKEPIFC
jgi:hypothetical protein